MSVTTKKGKEDPLTLYVDFLNVDLSADPRPRLRKGQKLIDFLNEFERVATLDLITGESVPNPTLRNSESKTILTGAANVTLPSRNWLEEAKALQKEMKMDLFLIAARKEFPEKLYHSDDPWVFFIAKLNEMRFRRRWTYLPSKNKKHRITIKAENFKRQYTQKYIRYGELAELLESGDLERLRLCFMCHKYFAARDQRQRFCGTQCKREYDNKDARFRVKRYRAKQKKDSKKEDRNRRYEQGVNGFCEFVRLAMSHSQDTKDVGPMVLGLGQGDAIKGWRMIKQWHSKLKNGESPHQIFNDLSKEDKDHLSKLQKERETSKEKEVSLFRQLVGDSVT